jgi:HAD superfamily hydrolase (TIGR01509 family)
MFEAILFDFDGTLVDFVESDIQSLKLLHAHTGSAINFDDFLETSVDEIMKFHNLVAEHKIEPWLMHNFRLKNTFARHNIDWRDDYVNFYRENMINLCVPFDGVKQFLNKVKKKVKTGLISNAYDGLEQRERISKAGIYDYFDVIVVAGETGIYKPDPSIFLFALNHLNVSPAKALYIGDSVTYDIMGAKSAGMRTVLFCQHSKKDNRLADFIVLGIDGLDLLMNQVL